MFAPQPHDVEQGDDYDEQDTAQHRHGHQRIAIDEGLQCILGMYAIDLTVDDTVDVLRVYMRDFLVQNADENRVSILADRHGNSVAENYIAVGVEVVIVSLVNITLRSYGFDKGHIRVTVVDSGHTVSDVQIIAALLGRVHVLYVGLGIEMWPGAGDDRFFRQGLVLAHDGDIVKREVREGQGSIVCLGPVVIVIGIHDEVGSSLGQLFHHILMGVGLNKFQTYA